MVIELVFLVCGGSFLAFYFFAVDFIFVLLMVIEEIKLQIISKLYMSFHASKCFAS